MRRRLLIAGVTLGMTALSASLVASTLLQVPAAAPLTIDFVAADGNFTTTTGTISGGTAEVDAAVTFSYTGTDNAAHTATATAGATKSTYKLVTKGKGKRITVKVTLSAVGYYGPIPKTSAKTKAAKR